jgi:hypothetical protein
MGDAAEGEEVHRVKTGGSGRRSRAGTYWLGRSAGEDGGTRPRRTRTTSSDIRVP